MSATRYPDLESTLWRSSARVPALARIIAFGAEDGYLAAVDTSGAPVRIDIRLGTVTTSRDDTVAVASSADGGAIYALTTHGEITRYTPSGGDWRFTPTLPAHALYAQTDGSLIVAGAKGDRAIVWRVRPPGQDVTDSLSFDIGGNEATLRKSLVATAGAVGDRVFFGGNEEVIAVRTRDLAKALEVDIGDPVTAITATPSGDRLFVAIENEELLRVVDRFEEGVKGKITLPGVPRALRMDPLGRVLLARGGADSVYVISLGSDAVIGIVRSAWRGDLPLVLPDAWRGRRARASDFTEGYAHRGRRRPSVLVYATLERLPPSRLRSRSARAVPHQCTARLDGLRRQRRGARPRARQHAP